MRRSIKYAKNLFRALSSLCTSVGNGYQHCVKSLHAPTPQRFMLLIPLSVIPIAFTDVAHSQISFEELKQSEAYFRLESAPSSGAKTTPGKGKRKEFFTNYDSLWESGRSAKLLLQWIEIRVPNHQLELGITGLREDHLVAEARLRNRNIVDVYVTIQVPKPQYKGMAELKTLGSFNRFRPPALEVVGSQKIDIQGIQADYYRIKDGSCSLLIPTDQMGLINLSVSKCPNSGAMFDVAGQLNLLRFNQKLNS